MQTLTEGHVRQLVRAISLWAVSDLTRERRSESLIVSQLAGVSQTQASFLELLPSTVALGNTNTDDCTTQASFVRLHEKGH